jgi:hypothetical protein
MVIDAEGVDRRRLAFLEADPVPVGAVQRLVVGIDDHRQRHQVVAAPGVGHRQHHRLGTQVDPGRRVQRVDIGAHHVLERRVGEAAHVHELVHWRGEVRRLGDAGDLRARDVHDHQRQAIDHRLYAGLQRVLRLRLLGCGRSLGLISPQPARAINAAAAARATHRGFT